MRLGLLRRLAFRMASPSLSLVTREGAPAGSVSLSLVETEHGPRVVEGEDRVDGESQVERAQREMHERTLDAWKR